MLKACYWTVIPPGPRTQLPRRILGIIIGVTSSTLKFQPYGIFSEADVFLFVCLFFMFVLPFCPHVNTCAVLSVMENKAVWKPTFSTTKSHDANSACAFMHCRWGLFQKFKIDTRRRRFHHTAYWEKNIFTEIFGCLWKVICTCNRNGCVRSGVRVMSWEILDRRGWKLAGLRRDYLNFVRLV